MNTPLSFFASNNTHYLNKDDSDAHDVLLCIKDGERKSTQLEKEEDLDLVLKILNTISKHRKK